jgi:hypothetical protein
MSTTWVFLGIMGGREIGISIEEKAGPQRNILHALKLTFKDLAMALVGLGVSIAMVLINNPD